MRKERLFYDAVTTKDISGPAIGLIPTGTPFVVWNTDNDLGYASCSGLGITSIWHNEYKIVSDKPLTKEEAIAKGVPEIIFSFR